MEKFIKKLIGSVGISTKFDELLGELKQLNDHLNDLKTIAAPYLGYKICKKEKK